MYGGKTNVPAIPTHRRRSDLGGKLDSIILRLEKLNVLYQLVDQVTNLTNSLEFCHESTAELKLENVELKTRMAELGRDTWHSMRHNLIFYSIPETTNDQDCDATVLKFLRDELGITEDIGLERVHRTGKRFDGKCRPIVAKFSSFKHREVVRLAGPKLAGMRFVISEQIPKYILEFHKPDYFITTTCNPRWPEITSELDEMITNN